VKLEVRYEQIEITKGGLWDGKPDTYRRYIQGMPSYVIDGREVSEAEFSEARR
jgi:hypothetical protein